MKDLRGAGYLGVGIHPWEGIVYTEGIQRQEITILLDIYVAIASAEIHYT